MTVKSWERFQKTGKGEKGHPDPCIYDALSQSGTNATRAEKLARIWKVHPYSFTRNRYSKPALTVAFGTQTFAGSTDSVSAQPVNPTLPVPSSDKAVAKLLQKWRASELNIGVTIGEGREAADMIADRASKIANAARELRRKNFGGALAGLAGVSRSDRAGALKRMNSGHIASSFLELQYGWKPLLNDIYAASDIITDKVKPRTGVFRSQEKETGIITSNYIPLGDVRTVKCERRINLMVEVTNSATMPERMGLTDPFSIMWELTRFSFVADWFLPIGDSLLASHAKLNMKTSQASTTQTTQYVSQLIVRAGHTYGFWKAASSAVAEFNYVRCVRTVSFGVPNSWGIVDQIPGLLTPTWDPPLQRVFNAAALARTNLKMLRNSRI